jgi:hypothetical protein
MHARLRSAALILAAAFALTACSENPTVPIDRLLPSPLDFSAPESTLAVLTGAVHGRNAGIFARCLADSQTEGREFHASFDPADLVQFLSEGGVAPADWRRYDEFSFFPQLVPIIPSGDYSVQFTPDAGRGGIVDMGGPTEKWIYNLLYHLDSNGTAVVDGAVGLTFERVGSAREFKITYWEDRRSGGPVHTWGLARLRSR